MRACLTEPSPLSPESVREMCVTRSREVVERLASYSSAVESEEPELAGDLGIIKSRMRPQRRGAGRSGEPLCVHEQ